MPYVITTKRPGKYGPDHYAHEADVRSRIAVATLEEYGHDLPDYGSAGCVCGTHATPDLKCSVHAAIAYVERLPESGGTVGPLLDGTFIEVERVTWDRLREMADWRAGRSSVPSLLIDAFNARQP